MNKNEALKLILEFVDFAGDADESILHYCEDGQVELQDFDSAVKLLKSELSNEIELQAPNIKPSVLAEQMESFLDLAVSDSLNDSEDFAVEEIYGTQVIEMMRIIFERVIVVVAEQEELVWSDEEIKRIMENE